MSVPSTEPIPFGQRVADLAVLHPNDPVVTLVDRDGREETIAWADFDREVNRTARLLHSRGVSSGNLVAISIPIQMEHFFAMTAAWRLGATVLPLNPVLPAPELQRVLEVANEWHPTILIGEAADPVRPDITMADLATRNLFDDSPVENRTPNPGRAIASGGSTGRPKHILDAGPFFYRPGLGHFKSTYGLDAQDVMLITTRLYHAVGFNCWRGGLMEDFHVVVMVHFDAALTIDLIERHRVGFIGTVPTVLQRIVREPNVKERDFSSIKGMYHTGGPCPLWLKRAWMELVPPERVFDLYGAAEGTGNTVIRGDEWLLHPGSVGKAPDVEIVILDDNGMVPPPGEVGEIFSRRIGVDNDPFTYLGAPPARRTEAGGYSVGDLGWLDSDGYLYLADRRADLIVSGGANVYPAEVEAILTEFPDIHDAVVVGVPDAEWGKRVHAMVQPRDIAHPPDINGIDAFVRARLQSYKIPRSYDFMEALPRDQNGKIRRSAVAEAAAGNMV